MPQQPSGSLFRPILPSSRGSRATQEPPLPQRRQPVIAACEACRKRKVKVTIPEQLYTQVATNVMLIGGGSVMLYGHGALRVRPGKHTVNTQRSQPSQGFRL